MPRRHGEQPRDTCRSVPAAQSRTWSIAALAAEAADESPRASMIAAPRLPRSTATQLIRRAYWPMIGVQSISCFMMNRAEGAA